MKLFFWIMTGIGCMTIGVAASLLVAFGIKCLRDQLRAKNVSERHDHDCLVEACRFHQDPDVRKAMYQLLIAEKLRGIVITDHDLKEAALNLIIAEIRERRPLAGEESPSQEP